MWSQEIQNTLNKLQLELAEVLDRIELKKKKLDQFRPLPVSIVQKLKEQLNLEWSYNSNAIEGNTLNLAETQMVLHHGFTIRGKSLKEHLEVTNHHDAIDFVESLASQSTLLLNSDVRSIHKIVLQSIDKKTAGMYRTGAVRIVGAHFQPPDAQEVQFLMTELLEFINDSSTAWHVGVLAAVLHHRFVWIHPFFDGNGRTGRLLMNLFLMKHGYPPAVILKVDRKKYISSLHSADKGEYKKLGMILLQAVERSLDIYISAVAGQGGQYVYKPIDDIINEAEMPYGQEYISLLARQGKIDAYKEGRVWFTSEEAINTYLVNRRRKRTPVKSGE